MAEENNEQAAPAGAQNPAEGGPRFGLQRVYMKDASFEAPNGLLVLTEGQPKVSQDLNTQVNRIKDDIFEVVLKITITVNYGEKVAFLVEVHQAGLFVVSGLEAPQLQQVISTQCPHILFPYAREAIDSLAVRGGFAPLALPPIDFDALFVHAVQQQRKQAEEKAAAGEAPAAE